MQTNYALDNATGAAFRAALNAALQAVASMNSGPGEPPATYPGMIWPDTTNKKIKQRTQDNLSWKVIGNLDSENWGLATQVALQQGGYNTAVAGGTADAITATFTPAITADVLASGSVTLMVWPTAANATTTPTFTPGAGIAATVIVRGDDKPLSPGDIAGPAHPILLKHNPWSGKWSLLNPATGVVQQSQNSQPLVKADKLTPCLVKTGPGSLAIKAGTTVYLGAGTVPFTAQTAVSMPPLIAGTDYSVWVKPDGTAVAVADPFASPASAPAMGALKIGGFHYGLVAAGTTPASGGFNTATSSPLVSMVWAQSDVDAIAGINQWSIWDLSFRPLCDPRGMVCVTDSKGMGSFWFDIYFCGTRHIANGTSAYNTDVASGTVPPVIPSMFGGDGTTKYTTFTWYEAAEVAFSHKKRLMSYQEFAAAAFGVTESQSLGGASSTIPATARQAGYTSKWGGEQMSGHHWAWGSVAHGVGGSGWVSGPARGQSYGTPYVALFGGNRDSAGSSGSRCSYWNGAPWVSYWGFGLRAACDHLSL